MTAPLGMPPAFSTEIESRQDEGDVFTSPTDPQANDALATLYGTDFPLLKDQPTSDDWVSWVKHRWVNHSAAVRNKLHLVERNRLFRKGVQWIASVGVGPWREPPKPRDAARIVENVIAPALDLRVQIVAEQRPGVRVKPASQDPDDLKKADAKQIALEYQYDNLNKAALTRELEYWCGTDGVCFLEYFWNPEKGPWHELDDAAVDAAPKPQSQQQSQPGVVGSITPAGPKRFPLGDVDARVRRIEQVRVSPEATANIAPWYWIICDLMPRQDAVRKYGSAVAKEAGSYQSDDRDEVFPAIKGGYYLPDAQELLKNQDTVNRYTMYCEPSEYLQGGLQLTIVGDVVVNGPMPLIAGVVPMVRYTDGTTDPSFFPAAVVDLWINAQQRINAVKSKWYDHFRLNSGTKIAARANAIVSETLVGSNLSVIEIKGHDDISSVFRPIEGTSLALDGEKLLAQEVRSFENMSGWNDATRGSFSPDMSGRAILAIREQLERVFAPMVSEMAQGHTKGARIELAFMRWGYTIPRLLGVEGKGRPDLAREFSSDDFDGAADVFIDEETMMPMPRALKLHLLDDALSRNIIDVREYRRRMPYANVRDMGTPDDDQEARARRMAEFVRQSGQAMDPIRAPVLWQDNEAIHQDVLERELILPDDTPPPVRQAAQQRWTMLANQAKQKQTLPPPPPPKVTVNVPTMPLDPAQTAAVLQSDGIQVPQAQPMAAPMPKAPAGAHGSTLKADAGISPAQQPLLRDNAGIAANDPSVSQFEQVAQR